MVTAIALMPASSLPVLAAPQATFVRTEPSCTGKLANGEQYERQRLVLRWFKAKQELYTNAIAYYAPISGAFLWRGTTYTKAGYSKWANGWTSGR